MGTATRTASRSKRNTAAVPPPNADERRPLRQRKPNISDEYGDGKFLCITNRHAEPISFRDPQDAGGSGDLKLGSFATEIAEEFWLDVPWLLTAHANEMIDITRSNSIPPKIDLNVPAELDLHGTPLLNATAISIVLCETFGVRERAIILTPAMRSGGSNSTKRQDKPWLKKDGIKMLRNIIYREGKVRNRQEVIGLCQERITVIQAIE